MLDDLCLQEMSREFRRLKKLAEKALAQARDEHFDARLDEEANSLAVIVKHMAGNLRSRWTDFLTSDGEKPDRRRDSEFVVEAGDTRENLMERWEAGWRTLFETLDNLQPADLEGTVLIRGEPHTALRAIIRQLTHYGGHVGQIVLLAKHLAGPAWQTLSIPRGESEAFNATHWTRN